MKINIKNISLSLLLIIFLLFCKNVNSVSVSESLKSFNEGNYEASLAKWIQIINNDGDIDIEPVLAVALNVIIVNKLSNANDENEKISEAFFASNKYLNKQYIFQKAVINGDIKNIILYVREGDVDINNRLVELYRKANLDDAANLISSVRLIDDINFFKVSITDYRDSISSLLKLPDRQEEIIKNIFISNRIEVVNNKNMELFYVSQLCELLKDKKINLKQRDKILDLIRIIDSKLKLLRIIDIHNVKMSNYKYETMALLRIYCQNHQDDIDSIKLLFLFIFSDDINDITGGINILQEYLLKIKAPFTRDVRREFIKIYFDYQLKKKGVNNQIFDSNQILKADMLAYENNYAAAAEIYKRIFLDNTIDDFIREDAWIGLLNIDPKFAIDNSDLIIKNIKSANDEIYSKHIYWLGQKLSINAFASKIPFEIAVNTELNEKYLKIIDVLLVSDEKACLTETKTDNIDLRYSFSAIYAFSNKPEKASEIILRELSLTYKPPSDGWKGDFGEPVKEPYKPRVYTYPRISQVEQNYGKLLDYVINSSKVKEILPGLVKVVCCDLTNKLNLSTDNSISSIYLSIIFKYIENFSLFVDKYENNESVEYLEYLKLLQSVLTEINTCKNINYDLSNKQISSLIFKISNAKVRSILFDNLSKNIDKYKTVNYSKAKEQIDLIAMKMDDIKTAEFKSYAEKIREKIEK